VNLQCPVNFVPVEVRDKLVLKGPENLYQLEG
jgi:hypothetical protein